MRQLRILLVIVGLLYGCGLALAAANLTLTATVGYGGYYRPGTLVPLAVKINNVGDELRGEFHVTSRVERALHHYTFPFTVPRDAKQLKFLYITPHNFVNDLTVEFWCRGEKLAETTVANSQELYPTSRLLVVVGGNGSSFSYAGSQQLQLHKSTPTPRPWDFGADQREQIRGQYMGRGATTRNTGVLQIAYADRTQLPDNPEAYGSISTLALMSSVTENTLSAGAQEAIPLWVSTGGHLLIAGGGITSRFQAPFYAKLLHTTSSADLLVNNGGGQASTSRLGNGFVTQLSYDPDTMLTSDWQTTGPFYKKLFTKDADSPASVQLNSAINQAIMVRNLQPPNLTLIVIYLLVYLVTLVPINYFVLKKIDKRELAWITTPAIVLLFTLGAYGIGYATKGHRLVLNQVSIIETTAGQPIAEAVSALLIFSPARTSYNLDAGDKGLLVSEVNRNEDAQYSNFQQTSPITAPLSFVEDDAKLQVRDIGVNMWDFRQFATLHQVNMQGGITANLHKGDPGISPRATGTVTNNTPYRFTHCELYCDDALVAKFSLDPKQTVTVEKMGTQHTPKLSEDEQHMFDNLQPQIPTLFNAANPSTKGLVLLGYTTDSFLPTRLSNHAPTTTLTLFVVHL